jgi:hypothetical protein
MGRACGTLGIGEKSIQNETTRIPRRRWEGNIKMDLKAI